MRGLGGSISGPFDGIGSSVDRDSLLGMYKGRSLVVEVICGFVPEDRPVGLLDLVGAVL